MITIIIPVYNEESIIREILGRLPYGDGVEVIVVDAASKDRTIEFTKRYPVRVVECIRNRAEQMNRGAQMAGGDILLFLHADCLFEKGSLEAIEDSLKNGCIGGCLSQRIDSGEIIYRIIEASGNIRARLFKVFYGDQAVFVRRDIFKKIGGFDNVELFEDIIFSKKLRRAGKTRILNKRVYVSPRRWKRQGIIKTTLINYILTLGFLLGFPAAILKRIYLDVREPNPSRRWKRKEAQDEEVVAYHCNAQGRGFEDA